MLINNNVEKRAFAKKDNDPKANGLVSIIIPTRNSARTIGKCLESIHLQTYYPIEILIVDGNSSDNTREIAVERGAITLLFDGERHKAKNFGTSKASGEFVLFLDSDMILEPPVITECIKTITSSNIGGIIIPERSIGYGFWIRVRDFERSLYAGSTVESARFFRKEVVELAGGFDENVIFYEESTLPQRVESLGLVVNKRISSYILHNEEGFQLGKWLAKKRYYSDSLRSYANKYGYAKSQVSIRYRVGILTRNGKWKLLLRHPVLTAGVFILKGLEYVASKT